MNWNILNGSNGVVYERAKVENLHGVGVPTSSPDFWNMKLARFYKDSFDNLLASSSRAWNKNYQLNLVLVYDG